MCWLPGNVHVRTQWSIAWGPLVTVTSTLAPVPQSSRTWYRTSHVAVAAWASGRETNGTVNAPVATAATANATQTDDRARLVNRMGTPRSILEQVRGAPR